MSSLQHKIVIGHRGASAYAPENTIPSFELALQQGAEALEHDLQVTKDGVLVCLHDLTLERTTNVRELFPGRARDAQDSERTRQWFVHDFTVAEVKRLDAGSWFGPSFVGTCIPTFQELVDCVGHRATLLAELKDLEVYHARGIDQLALFETLLRRNSLNRTRFDTSRLMAQSFHEPTVRRAATMFDGRLPLVLLVEPGDVHRWADSHALSALSTFAMGIGPGKAMLDVNPSMVAWAHAAGLRVTPWTFSASSPGRFANVRDEMTHYLSVLDVDAVITDNPDQCPRAALAR